MEHTEQRSGTESELRRRAEAIVRGKESELQESLDALSPEKIRQVVHELQVHQIELEMQNDELRRAHAELDAARARYFDLYHLAPMGYASINEKGLFLEVNLTAATLLDVPRGVLIKQPITRYILPEDQTIYYRHRKELFDSGEPQACEVRMMKKDGTLFWARLEAIVSQDDDGSQVCRLTMSDISARKQAEDEHLKLEHLKLEQQIQQTQKLESLGVLASGIAHDFNNLMGGIFGYIDLAMEKSTDPIITQYLTKAMTTIERARGLTGQLLTFAKGGAPVQKITALFPFVEETVHFALSGSNVSCRFDVMDNLWMCNIDRNQIEQVIDNIIINAEQAMPNGGTIEITARNVSLEGNEFAFIAKGHYVCLSIKDTGIGILKESLPHIFDPFYTTKSKGHGLGLATCYSIIHRHGGTIDVESEPGRGSTFHVYLPASTDVASVVGLPEVTHAGSGTFIVMDDEDVMRDTIRNMLQTFGYTVVCMHDGREAIHFFTQEANEKRPIAGMILDLTVPGGMGGKTAVAEIRRLSLNADIPIFAASGYADDPVMKNPEAFGFTASICKPFRKSELAEMLEKKMKRAE